MIATLTTSQNSQNLKFKQQTTNLNTWYTRQGHWACFVRGNEISTHGPRLINSSVRAQHSTLLPQTQQIKPSTMMLS